MLAKQHHLEAVAAVHVKVSGHLLQDLLLKHSKIL